MVYGIAEERMEWRRWYHAHTLENGLHWLRSSLVS